MPSATKFDPGSCACSLWELHSQRGENLNVVKGRVFSQLSSIYKDWYGVLACLIPNFWINWQVQTGLSAYKFDLIGTEAQKSKLGLFTRKEQSFVNQRTDRLFKSVLGRTEALTTAQKAEQWEAKAKKYSGKPSLMMVNQALFLLSTVFPCIKQLKGVAQSWIMANAEKWLSKLSPSAIESLKQTLTELKAEDIPREGILKLLRALLPALKTEYPWIDLALFDALEACLKKGDLTASNVAIELICSKLLPS